VSPTWRRASARAWLRLLWRAGGRNEGSQLQAHGPGKVSIITLKDPGLEILRHSTSHSWPLPFSSSSQDPGHHRPAIETGFYTISTWKKPLTDDDLAAVEAKMRELIQSGKPSREAR